MQKISHPVSYRATLGSYSEADGAQEISLICEGVDEFTAALNAEHLAPGW